MSVWVCNNCVSPCKLDTGNNEDVPNGCPLADNADWQKAPAEVCEWRKPNPSGSIWNSGCGKTTVVQPGGKEYCHYCGKLLKVIEP